MNVWCLAIALSLIAGCTSPRTGVEAGIQPSFRGASFAKIAFFPVFSVPDPTKNSQIDMAEITASSLYDLAEKESLRAFSGQKLIQGLSPQAVRKLTQEEERQSLIDYVLTSAQQMGTISSNSLCGTAPNFASFYAQCINKQNTWREKIQLLSSKLQNADAILLLILSNIHKTALAKQSSLSGEITALLIDANNGQLVWNRQQFDELKADTASNTFPDWKPLMSRLLSDAFWQGFPGRTERAE